MNPVRFLIVFLLILFIIPKEVFATFDMSIEDNYKTIDFGAMELDEEKTLVQRGGYEHQFNFNSTNGETWYFKAQILRPFTSMTYTIPPENFQWIVEELINGQGILSANVSKPAPFSTTPVLIYTSAGNDETGTRVRIRLKYRLKIPKNQTAGVYTAHIRFIMVEEL